MLHLPDVTLYIYERRDDPTRTLARMAVEDCLKVAEFGDIIIMTDKPEAFAGLSARVRFIDAPAGDKVAFCRTYWYDVPKLLHTSYMLTIGWDGWITNPAMWSNRYLEYDFIGPPWWYTDGKNVGNSGFSLKSTALAQYICDRRLKYPCNTSIEDDLLCRKYRPKLEEVGFVWAPEKLAKDFAFECLEPEDPSAHFGFHAVFNWPLVIKDEDQLMQRLNLAYQSEYIREGALFKEFQKQHPYLAMKLIKSPADQPIGVDDGKHFSLHGESVS